MNQNGADIKVVDQRGRTAVHVAAELGLTQAILLLYRRGGPIDKADNEGITPVDLALQQQNAGTILFQPSNFQRTADRFRCFFR